MLLVVDNGSIYTKQLVCLLHDREILFERHPPHLLSIDNISEYDSFVLSGRRRNEKKTNQINSQIILHSIKKNSKLLGICYGAEILALTLGGTIKRSQHAQKGSQSVKTTRKNPICDRVLDVFASHSYEISKLPAPLVSLAESENCRYEIIQYQNRPIFGTQFHPEMTRDGSDLIANFCRL